MDTDPGILLQTIAEECARSKYSIEELEQIYWNEVRPAVRFNLYSVAGEWTGFEIDWLTARILRKHRFGRALRIRRFHPESAKWWEQLSAQIEQIRKAGGPR